MRCAKYASSALGLSPIESVHLDTPNCLDWSVASRPFATNCLIERRISEAIGPNVDAPRTSISSKFLENTNTMKKLGSIVFTRSFAAPNRTPKRGDSSKTALTCTNAAQRGGDVSEILLCGIPPLYAEIPPAAVEFGFRRNKLGSRA